MKLIILQSNNPFTTDSAYASHMRCLIKGLAELKVNIFLLIIGVPTNNETNKINRINIKNIKIMFLRFNFINNSYLSKRIFTYFAEFFYVNNVISLLNKLKSDKHEKVILWPSEDTLHIKASMNIARLNSNFLLFFEIVEYLDLYKHRKEKPFRHFLNYKRKKLIEKKFLPTLKGVAFITQALLEKYSYMLNSSVIKFHLPMVVDFDRFKEVKCTKFQNQKLFNIVYLGSLNIQKEGLDILLYALKTVVNKYDNVVLHLYGQYQKDVKIIMKLINKLKLKNHVFYKGVVNSKEVPKVLTCSDLLVMSRPNSYQSRGGFPTKLGEYLASGKPVCATKVGEIPNYLEDNKSIFFAEPNDPNSLADSILYILDNKEKALDVGREGRKVAFKYFNCNNQSKILYEFLNRL